MTTLSLERLMYPEATIIIDPDFRPRSGLPFPAISFATDTSGQPGPGHFANRGIS
jgi:hypothetical protein